MSDYLPKRESDLKTFALNFAALAKASPVSYALVAADAAVIEAVAKEYAEKLDRAVNPPTRTAASIIEKNQAKEELVAVLRGYAMQIKNNRAVTEASKANLGLSTADFVRTALPAPATRPQPIEPLPLRKDLAMLTRQHPLAARGMARCCARAGPLVPCADRRLLLPCFFTTGQEEALSVVKHNRRRHAASEAHCPALSPPLCRPFRALAVPTRRLAGWPHFRCRSSRRPGLTSHAVCQSSVPAVPTVERADPAATGGQ